MKYRPEIDGLRAIAVLSVLLFHLGVPGITGGFTGVDIFFVISGYLITGILLRDLESGTFSLARFYRRRALRILPALFAVLLATVILSRWVLLPSEMATLGRSIVAALLFVSNIFFWSELDYFNQDAKENPLLHTWSLGVEEQFYILVPLGMWLVYRYARRWLVPVFALSVFASFALSVYAVGPMPRASFYLLPTRYWELGAGSLLALAGTRIAPRGMSAHGLAGVGLVLIAAGLFWLTPDSVFPGLTALFPVLGSVALIAAGRDSFAGRILSTAGPVWVGGISYSLYLWHWPLIVLWKLRTDPYFSPLEILVLGGLSIILAALSTKFIEQPFRHLGPDLADRRVLWPAAVALVVGSAVGWFLTSHPQTLRSYTAQVLALDEYAEYQNKPRFRTLWQVQKCHVNRNSGGFKTYDAQTCLKQDDRPMALVFGDSHAAHIWAGLARARPDLNVVQASAVGCRPLPVQTAATFCQRIGQFIYDEWTPEVRPRTVVLSGAWWEEDLPGIAAGILKLRNDGVSQVVVLGNSVAYTTKFPKIIGRALLQGADETEQISRHLVSGQWALNEALHDVVETAGGVYVDLLAHICPQGPTGCKTRIANIPFLFDTDHYTIEAAEQLGAEIAGHL